MGLDEIYAPIKQELEEVEERLAGIIASEVYPVEDLSNYVILSGGKRIRPALVLLSSKLLDYDTSKAIDAACAVELIHVASLIHDDIVDSAKLRRGKPSAHVLWGNKIAVIMGDYLFSQAMELLTKYENPELVKVFTKVVKNMSEGELLQIANHRNIDLTEEEYINIITGKTAVLMSASCEIATKIAFAPESHNRALSQYGLNVGILYQIMDDVLDIFSTEERLGKPVRNNLREGNITLPMIYALASNNGEFKQQLLSILSDEKVSNAELWKFVDSIVSSNALSYSESTAKTYVNLAKEALNVIKDSTAKRCLLYFADLIMDKLVHWSISQLVY